MPENPVHILDYAPRPQLWRRRPFRLAVFAVLVLTFVATGVYWYPDISFRIRLAYWQHQCMTHVIPPDKVILTADPKLVPTLLRDPDYVQTTALGRPATLAAYSPRCYREYQRLALAGSPSVGDAIIFMHRLRNQQGIERLVIAFDQGGTSANGRPEECITVAIFQPRPLVGELDGLRDACQLDVLKNSSAFTTAPMVRTYAGQLDPADPSHFTIRWQAAGLGPFDPTPTRRSFDFRLSADGTTVTRTDLATDASRP